MSIRLFDKGRAALAGASSWLTDTIQAMQVALDTADTAIKVITAVTNASPMVVTAASHGYSNGDVVVQRGVGGCTAANGTFKVASVTTNTYALTTLKDGQNTTGNAAYTSGGSAIDLTLAAVTADVNGGIVGAAVTLTTPTVTNGVLDADDATFTGVSGLVDAIIIYDNTTGIPLVFVDGKQQVVMAADAATSATTLAVEPLIGAIASGVAMVFSNGVTATTSAPAVAGARTITVTALGAGITAGHTADVVTTGAGLPYTGGGGSYTYQWDNGANKIIKL